MCQRFVMFASLIYDLFCSTSEMLLVHFSLGF